MHFRYDVALMRLSSSASLNSYVQLASLPPSGQVLPHNNPCYITGWGLTSSQFTFKYNKSAMMLPEIISDSFLFLSSDLHAAGGSISAQLKQAYLPVVDYNNCSRSDWWGSTVKNTMVCAGGGSDSGCNVRKTIKQIIIYFL